MAPPPDALPTLESLPLTLADIAELAGVRRPVVTTWRRRHGDFPQPCGADGARPLFEAREVCAWLVATGRAQRERIEPDLCLHAVSALGAGLPPAERLAATTALVCLRHLDGEPLAEASTPRLRDRAEDVDPADELLRTEITALPDQHMRLATTVDELVEAAWGCREAFEHIMGHRGRLGLGGATVSPLLARLVAGVSGVPERAATSGSLVLADPYAGAGDLLTALLATMPESCAPVVHAATSDHGLARLLRRRLIVRDVPGEDLRVRAGELGGTEPDAIVTQLPYRPAERRDANDVLARIDDIGMRLAPERTAVVLGPADVLTGALHRYSEAERARAKLLSTGMVEAVIRLPGGMVPFRPGYETALCVLTSAHASPLKGRVLLGDVSGQRLTDEVVDALVTDVTTWRRGGYRPVGHTRRFCVQADVAGLVDSAGPLVAPRLPTVRDRATQVPETVARVAELERTLADAASSRRTARPPVRTGIVRAQAASPEFVSVGDLLRAGTLTLVTGARLDAADIGAGGAHRVLGAREVAGDASPGGRTIDRAVLVERYPRAVLTEPGDVVVTTTPLPAALLDKDGFSVVEFPARALRVPASRRESLPPRVLAALLPSGGTRRAEPAVRASRRLRDWELPALDPAAMRAADAVLERLERRRAVARRELDALDEVGTIMTTGLRDGTLTFQPGHRLDNRSEE